MKYLARATAGCIAAAAVLYGLDASAQTIPTCTRTSNCEQAVANCLEYRNRTGLPRAELPCEQSLAVCRSTGVWRGKYTRGTPEVLACRMPK